MEHEKENYLGSLSADQKQIYHTGVNMINYFAKTDTQPLFRASLQTMIDNDDIDGLGALLEMTGDYQHNQEKIKEMHENGYFTT